MILLCTTRDCFTGAVEKDLLYYKVPNKSLKEILAFMSVWYNVQVQYDDIQNKL